MQMSTKEVSSVMLQAKILVRPRLYTNIEERIKPKRICNDEIAVYTPKKQKANLA